MPRALGLSLTTFIQIDTYHQSLHAWLVQNPLSKFLVLKNGALKVNFKIVSFSLLCYICLTKWRKWLTIKKCMYSIYMFRKGFHRPPVFVYPVIRALKTILWSTDATQIFQPTCANGSRAHMQDFPPACLD